MLLKIINGGSSILIKLRIDLLPRNNTPLPIDYYKSILDNVCFDLLRDKDTDYKSRINKYNSSSNDKKAKWLFNYSKFNCLNYEINGTSVIFKDKVIWYISSPVYELILHLVQKFFNMTVLKIGESEFEVVGLCISEEIELKNINQFELLHPNCLEDVRKIV